MVSKVVRPPGEGQGSIRQCNCRASGISGAVGVVHGIRLPSVGALLLFIKLIQQESKKSNINYLKRLKKSVISYDRI